MFWPYTLESPTEANENLSICFSFFLSTLHASRRKDPEDTQDPLWNAGVMLLEATGLYVLSTPIFFPLLALNLLSWAHFCYGLLGFVITDELLARAEFTAETEPGRQGEF